MLQFISHQTHVVGSRSGKRQEAGEAHPFNPSVKQYRVKKCRQTITANQARENISENGAQLREHNVRCNEMVNSHMIN